MDTTSEGLQQALITEIKVCLAAKGWRQSDLAEQVGITRETMNRYMRLKTPLPMSVYWSISRAFELEPGALMLAAQNRAGL